MQKNKSDFTLTFWYLSEYIENQNCDLKKQFTSNPMLNELLNETAATPASQEMMDYSTMNFKSEMAEAFGAERQQAQPSMPLVTKGQQGEPVNMADENVATTVKAMTRDYSSLIKAIDKKNGKMGTK